MALDLFSYLLGSTINSGGGGGNLPQIINIETTSESTMVLTDSEEKTHLLEIEYGNRGEVIGLVYDGENVEIIYGEDGSLESINRVSIDIADLPMTSAPTIKGAVNIGSDINSIIDLIIMGAGEIPESPTWPIPSDYTSVRYLESDGNYTFINTEVIPSQHNGYGILINEFTPVSYVNYPYGNDFFGCNDDVTTGRNTSCLGIDYRQSDTYPLLTFAFDKHALLTNPIDWGTTRKLECGFSKTLGYAYAKVNDVVEANVSASYTPASNPVRLFTHSYSSTYYFPSKVRLGEIIITSEPVAADTLEGAEILRHLYPAVGQNNRPCMYDTITQQAYYGGGSGTLIVGWQ